MWQRLSDPRIDCQNVQEVKGHRKRWLQLDYGNANLWERWLQCLACSQSLAQIVDEQDTGEWIAAVFPYKTRSVLPFLFHIKVSHLGLAAKAAVLVPNAMRILMSGITI